MSRLKRLLRVANPSTATTQQTPVQARKPVAQHMHAAQQAESIDLQAAAGDDWPDIQDDPEALDALSKAIQTQRVRERGVTPPHYTGRTTCKHCGAVPIFQGVPDRVAGLPLPKALH